MLAKLTLSTLLTPCRVPIILSQYAGSLTPVGPACGPMVTPAAGVEVTSMPGVVGTVAAGEVAVGVAGLAECCIKPGIKKTPRLNMSASARITALITTQRFLGGRGGRRRGCEKVCTGDTPASCPLFVVCSDGGAEGLTPCSFSISCCVLIGLLPTLPAPLQVAITTKSSVYPAVPKTITFRCNGVSRRSQIHMMIHSTPQDTQPLSAMTGS